MKHICNIRVYVFIKLSTCSIASAHTSYNLSRLLLISCNRPDIDDPSQKVKNLQTKVIHSGVWISPGFKDK